MEPNAKHHPHLTSLIAQGKDFELGHSRIHPSLYEAAIALDDFTAYSALGETETQAILNLEEQMAEL